MTNRKDNIMENKKHNPNILVRMYVRWIGWVLVRCANEMKNETDQLLFGMFGDFSRLLGGAKKLKYKAPTNGHKSS